MTLRRTRRRLAPAAGMALAAALLTAIPAFAAGSGLSPAPPEGYSPNGRAIYNLYTYVISPVALIVLVAVEAAIVWVMWRYRRSRRPPGFVPPQWHGNNRLEVIWTVIPAIIIAAISVASFVVLQDYFVTPADASTDLNVTVTAYQFGWDYEYPDQGVKITSSGQNATPLVLPVNKTVRVKLQSRDVIHGYWVPELTGKTDAVPSYTNYTWYKIDRVGEFRGECTELCGVGHYTMQILVKSVTQADFDAWVAQQKRS